MRKVLVALMCGLMCADALGQASRPVDAIRIHPENSKYFLFRGKPLVLIAAGEHYGSVVNRAFDFERYLEDAADKKQTVTRTFLLYREQQTSRNPSSPIKPESPDFIAPYPRIGPGHALDGEPLFDLDQWNPEYFERLHRFLEKASSLGIVVELTILSNMYDDSIWVLNPHHAKNNKQQVGNVAWQEYVSMKDPALLERQVVLAKKIVQETSHFDNVYYEICNEAGGGLADHSSVADVDAWLAHMGRVIRDELKRLDRKHLVFGSQAVPYTPEVAVVLDAAFAGDLLDGVNVHPWEPTILGGRRYMLGKFMSKDLQLKEYAAFCRATQSQSKPCVNDEDNCASTYRDPVGWTIHRKRAWMSVLNQVHYDYIDFSITVGSETGTKASQKAIRSWMKYLSEFMHSFDFIHAQPRHDWIESKPDHLVDAVLATELETIAYLADDREWKDPAAGQPIEGEIAFHLPAGEYRVCFYSPITGLYSPCVKMHGGDEPIRLELPVIVHDIVLRITKAR